MSNEVNLAGAALIPLECASVLELVEEKEERHPDFALVEECRKGNSAAFDEIVHRYKDRVYRVAYRFLGNHEDAQDVAQEVFIRAYQGIDRFEGKSKVYTWLYSIAGNLAKNRIRDSKRKGRNKGSSLEAMQEYAGENTRAWESHSETPEESARKHETEEALQACLAELPEHYRIVFVLRTFEQLNYEEIAETVGCPKGTVKSRLNFARRFLHERLTEQSVL